MCWTGAARRLAVRCLVLSGSGRVFQHRSGYRRHQRSLGSRSPIGSTWKRRITASSCCCDPSRNRSSAAINGPVAGAALGLAMAADIRWSSDAASFVFGFTRVGLSADSGTGLQPADEHRLGQSDGDGLYQPTPLRPRSAQFWIGQQDAAGDELMPQVHSPGTAAFGWTDQGVWHSSKRAFNHIQLEFFDARPCEYEAYLQELAGRTADHREGVSAFTEKRPPRFRGE